MDGNNLDNIPPQPQPENIVALPTEPYNPELSKKVQGKSNSFLIILSVFLIVLVGIIAFLGYQNYQLQKQISLLTATPSSSPTPIATIDSTADWKTYTDVKKQFSFKYPNNLEPLSQNEGGIASPFTGNPIFVAALADRSTIAQGTDKPFDGLSIDIVNTKGSFDSYVSNEVKAETESPRGIENSTVQTININSQNWYVDSEASLRRYFLKSGNTVVAISVKHFSPNFLTIVDQILSTFKFLGQDCSDSVMNISITPPNSRWKCTVEGNAPENKIIFLKREDGLQVAFPKITGVDSFPSNCPENITNLNLGDSHQPVKLCKNTISLQSEILQQIIYNQTLATSSYVSDGLFYISMNTSLNLTASDKQELKSMFDSIKIIN